MSRTDETASTRDKIGTPHAARISGKSLATRLCVGPIESRFAPATDFWARIPDCVS
jgi:hypothetical protein